MVDTHTVKYSASISTPNQTDRCQKTRELEQALVTLVQFEGLLGADEKFSLLDRMAHYKIPGVSMALIESGEIAWAKTWGVKNAEQQTDLSPDTLFQAASISKKVAAFAALQLVEAGDLRLDKPINQYLKCWQLPENDLTRQQPVTLAQLLSHTAGTTVHGFRGYAQSEVQPSAIQILEGNESAVSDPVMVDTLPGTQFRYSGGGTTVVQMAMEDVTGKPFSQILHEQVLQPSGMTRSTFENPLPETFQQDVACGHLAGGQLVPDKWHNYPMQAAASLWCTPSDLVKFSLAVLRSCLGEEDALLSKTLCDQYLSEHKNVWGLGPRLFIQNGKTIGFHHGGANEGYRCNSVTFLDGRGAVVMTNSDQGDALLGEIMATLATLYDWPECQPKEQKWRPLSADDQAQLTGVFTLMHEDEAYEAHVSYQDQELDIRCPIITLTNPFYYIEQNGDNWVAMNSSGAKVQFSINDQGESVVMIFGNTFIRQESVRK